MRSWTCPWRWAGRILSAAALVVSVAGLSTGAAAQEPASGWREHADPTFVKRITSTLGTMTMAQDEEGFLWLGTQTGLVRWDGYKLRRYASAAEQEGSLPDSFITALMVDSRGRLWVGTSAGGLVGYDRASDRFRSPLRADARLSHRSVFALQDDGEGGLWVGTGRGLDHVDPKTGHIRRYAGNAAETGLPAQAVQALALTPDKALWVGTDKGLFRRAAGQGRFAPVDLVPGGQPPHVKRLLVDPGGRLWIGTRSHGAFVVTDASATARSLKQLARSTDRELERHSIFALVAATDTQVWLGTEGGGIVRVDTSTWRVRRERHLDQIASSLPDNDVYALFRDRHGVVWVSTDTALSSHAPRERQVSSWLYGGHAQLSHLNVPALLTLDDGRVWLASGDGGVDIVHPDQGRVARIKPDAAHAASALPLGRVISMLRGPDGQIYLGTQHGLYRSDGQGKRVQRIEIDGRSPVEAVWAMTWLGDRLWLGGVDGLWGLSPTARGEWRVDHRDAGAVVGDARITTLLPARDGTLWVGTRTGLARLDTGAMTAQRVANDTPRHAGVPWIFISSLAYDARGRLWVGTFGEGLRLLATPDDPAGPVQRIGVNQGLPHNGVDALVVDAQGDVWASTDDGLARVRGSDLSVDAFGAERGVGIQVYWTNSAGMASDGSVIFGGTGGVTIVDPRQPKRASGPPAIAVTELKVGNEPTQPAYGRSTAAVTVAPAKRDVLVEFVALDYFAPEKNKYEHRLVGYDAQWVASDHTRRLAAYTNLPPGRHMLELRAAGHDGVWSSPLRIPLDVVPNWYETAWFKLLAGAAAATLLLGFAQARTVYLRRRQRALEALVAERTRQLADSQRELEKIAYFDSLTGLANRRLFNDELRRLCAQTKRSGVGFALLLIDLDKFKHVNDTLGHDAGDALLVAVARALEQSVRETDRVARLGGDEFAILLPEATADERIACVCERLFGKLAQPVDHQGQRLQPQASVGAAICPVDGQTPDELYKSADLALYAAKGAGRNCWRRYKADGKTARPDTVKL
jgi:diguanylate cyclase (GGDEF)-like protein